MSEHCPHCEAKLPLVVDAFCPECGNRVDEPPAAGKVLEERIKDIDHGPTLQLSRAWYLAFLGSLMLVITIVGIIRGEFESAIYTGSVGAIMVVVGLMWIARLSKSGRAG